VRVGAGLYVSRPSGTQRNDNRGLRLALPAMNRPATIGSPYGAAEVRKPSTQVLIAEQKEQSIIGIVPRKKDPISPSGLSA